jgi:hypothetical protein
LRIEQLGRMTRLIRENEAALQRAVAHDAGPLSLLSARGLNVTDG